MGELSSDPAGLTFAVLLPRKSLTGYTERPPRPKGVKVRRPNHALRDEAEAFTVAARSNGVLARC